MPLAASLVFHMRRDALLLSGDAIVELTLNAEGQCEMTTRNNQALQGRVLGSTFVALLLIVVNLRCDDGRARTIALLPDNAAAEDRRRLRVWLRYRIPTAETGSNGS